MAQLAGAGAGQGRHVHPVVVDQPQGQRAALHGHQDHVAVLQVGMGNARLAEPRRQLHPQVQEHLEILRPLEVFLDELVERQPFHPAHLQHREPPAADADALLQVLEINRKGELRPVPGGRRSRGNALAARTWRVKHFKAQVLPVAGQWIL